MNRVARTKGETTRQHLFDVALSEFRRHGFARTTMRDIARAAGLSLGAAYHYFPSKDALVLAYYEWMQAEHERLELERSKPGADLATRLRTLLVTKLELLRGDRKLLAALFANLGDASHPLSMFGKKTAAVRERSLSQFSAVFDEPSLSSELRELLGRALWLAHLGIFLAFIHDRSPGQARTHALVETLVDLTRAGVPLLASPLGAPFRNRLLTLVAEVAPTPRARR